MTLTPRTAKPTPDAVLLRQSANYDVWGCAAGEQRMIPVPGTPDPDVTGLLADKFRERERLSDAVRSETPLANLYPKDETAEQA